ncbi:MAG: hypothetical protein ACOY5S_00990 [Pseudomonadota bacterium]
MAIYAVIQSFMLLAGLFGTEINSDEFFEILGPAILVTFSLSVSVALIIWFLAPRLARRATTDLSEHIAIEKLTPEGLATAGLVVAGGVTLALTFPNLLSISIVAITGSSKTSIALIVAIASKLLLAAVLLFGARRIASRLVTLGRTAGRDDL